MSINRRAGPTSVGYRSGAFQALCSLSLAASGQLVLPGFFAGVTLACASPEAVPTHAAALSETRPPWRVEVYVWQRHVHAGVLSSMASVSAGGHVQRFNVLAAELAGGGAQPRVTPIDLRPYAALAEDQQLGHCVGVSQALSVRVASLRGSLRDHDTVLQALARALLDARRRALAAGLRPSELQVDFDATRGQLADYARWLIALKAALPDGPLTFTALPDWLRSPDFAGLARAADGFVLQGHALPDRAGPRTLCDPRAARRAAAAADTFGVPFRVALPTYSYGVARDARGRLVGVLAEGAAPRWPEGTRVEELRAEPADMLALAKALASAGHRHLRGLLWYRLPVPGDVRAWPLTTFLADLVEGRDRHRDGDAILGVTRCMQIAGRAIATTQPQRAPSEAS